MDWKKYAVGSAATPPKFNPTCRPFERVFHVTHQKEARRIFEDGRIRSGLVWDESSLNSHRACVSWVSANSWAYGSIYGNICFVFDWADLIIGKKFYWVEDMPKFRPPAFRILVSGNDCSTLGLKELDMSVPNGPVWSPDGKKWYFNSNYNSEFLIDDDIPLSAATSVDIVDHHGDICHGEPKCRKPYNRYSKKKEGPRFFAWLMGMGLTERDHFLDSNNPQGISSSTYHSLGWLYMKLNKIGGGAWNFMYAPPPSQHKILQNILLSWSNDLEVLDLMGCFSDAAEFQAAYEEFVSVYFGSKITFD